MKYSLLAVVLTASFCAYAQEFVPQFETVVEDMVFNTSSKIVIDEKAIKDSRAPSITSLLASQANIMIVNTPLQPNSIFIRGGDSGHILILVDGVPFYDAGTTQRTMNLNSLDVKSVRRIEVLKGSQTVLYGGQALSGVIKIDTIPSELKTRSGLQAQAGTQNRQELTVVHTQETVENQAVVLRGYGSSKDEESPVLNSSKVYPRNNWNGEASYVWKGSFEGVVKMNYVQDWNESPAVGGQDTDDYQMCNRQLAGSSYLRFHELPLQPRLALSTQNSLRTYTQPVNSTNTQQIDDKYISDLQTARLDLTPFKNEKIQVAAGLSYVRESLAMRSLSTTLPAVQTESVNTTNDQRGLFTKVDFNPIENVAFAIGGRYENWGDKDPVSTYQVGLTLFEKTKLEVSTGYKIPSLFHLYSATYGNPDLKEERSLQYSLSQEWDISANQNLSVTLFDYYFSNLIVAEMVSSSPMKFQYRNVSKSETRGIETVYTVRPSDSSSLSFTYGYQEPKDTDKATWLLRRPLVNGSIKYMHNWDKHTASLELVGVGSRNDSIRVSNQTVTVELPGYALANASYSYAYSADISLYTRFNNLADYRYQETYGYYTEGFSGYVGAEYWF